MDNIRRNIILFFIYLFQGFNIINALNIHYIVENNTRLQKRIQPYLQDVTNILSSYNIKPLGDNYKPDIDLEVYIGHSSAEMGILAWAKADYSLRNKLGRPLRGTITIFDTLFYTRLPYNITYLIIHELLHIMAFDPNLLQLNTGLLQTETALEVAKKHFNCSTMEGILMQGAHFDQAPYMEDIMAPQLRSKYINITPLTLAVLKDTKWWDVDINTATHSNWGKNWGCDFAMKSCLNTITTEYPYCEYDTYNCTYNKKGYGYCGYKLCPTIIESFECPYGCFNSTCIWQDDINIYKSCGSVSSVYSFHIMYIIVCILSGYIIDII